CGATPIVDQPICHRGAMAAHDDDGPATLHTSSFCIQPTRWAQTGAQDHGPRNARFVAKSCGAVCSHWLAPAPPEERNGLRVFSKLKHDLCLRSVHYQLGVCDAVLVPARCVNQTSRS